MNDLRKYSREFITEFIHLYKSLPAVWKINSKEYRNRHLKTQAYEVLVDKWKEVEPNADRVFVVKKINSMRSVYRREWKKLDRENSGSGTDKVFSSSLWYFNLLVFLNDPGLRRPSTSSLEHELIQCTKEEVESENEQITTQETSPIATSSPPPVPAPTPYPSSSASSNVSIRRRPIKRVRDTDNCEFTKTSDLDELLPKFDRLDRFDYMSKAWAETLRSLPNHQRIFAEKLISDVLIEAQLNTLSRESQLQVKNKYIVSIT